MSDAVAARLEFVPEGPLYFSSGKESSKLRMRWGIAPKRTRLLCAVTDYEAARKHADFIGKGSKVIRIDAVGLAARGYVFKNKKTA